MPILEFAKHLFSPDVNRRLIFRKMLSHAGHWVKGAADALEVLTHQRFGRQRSTLVPPDYLMYPADIHFIPCQLPQSLRLELPPYLELDVEPGQTPWCVLTISHYGELRPRFPRHHGDPLSFSEASLYVPVKGSDGSSCWFQPFGFPNNALSMFKGREVFGMPKMFGNHYIEELAALRTSDTDAAEMPDIWRISGRSGGSKTIDLRIRYAAWEELPQELMFKTLGAALGMRNAPGRLEEMASAERKECSPEMLAHEAVMKARVAEFDAMEEFERVRFMWWREGDPDDMDMWGEYFEYSAMCWAAAHVFQQPDPYEWAVEQVDPAYTERVRGRSPIEVKGLSGTGALQPKTLAALLKFLPPSRRTARVLSWKRNFTPEVETVDQVMQWDPKDFEVDAVTRSYMTYRRAHGIDLFELSDNVVQFRVGSRVIGFRPLIRQQCEDSKASGRKLHSERTYGVRWVCELLQRAALEPNEPKFEIDYLQKEMADRVRSDVHARALMAWGPEVWESLDTESAAGSPRMAPEDLPPVSSAGWAPGTQPGFNAIRDAIGVAGKELHNGEPFFPDASRGLDTGLRALVGDDPQLIWIEDGEILFDRHDARDEAWLIVQGSIEEWSHDTWLGTREVSHLIGARYPLAGMVRHSEAQAVRPTAVLRIEGAALRGMMDQAHIGGFRDYLTYYTGQQAVAQAMEAAYQLDVTSYQFFPGARAVVLPGPYKANEVEMFLVIVQRPTDGWVERSLPPGVEWHPKLPFALMLITRFADFGPAKIELDTGGGAEYSETGIMIPSLVDGKLKIFVPWIFPSNIQAMFAGRELYGYPKTYANTVFDMRNKRLTLRRKGESAMTIRYADREWKEVRLREVGYLMKCFGEIMAMDWEGISYAHHDDEIDAEALAARDRVQPPPPADQAPIIPLFGWVAPYMEVAARLIPILPTWIRTLPVACWKRNFTPTVRFPELASSTLRIPWQSTDFDVDEVASSGFIVTGLGVVKPFRILEPDGIKLSLKGETDLDPDDPSYDSTFWPVGTLGLYLYYDMEMTVGDTLIDYVASGVKGEPRLEHGPRARRRGIRPPRKK